jgi:hypothetical protein
MVLFDDIELQLSGDPYGSTVHGEAMALNSVTQLLRKLHESSE